jgi:predicted esterase
MVVLAALLKYKRSTPLGGVISCSGLQALDHGELEEVQIETIRQTPLFVYHGNQDGVL